MMDGGMDGCIDVWLDACMHVHMGGWMGGRVDVWMYRGMDGGIDG